MEILKDKERDKKIISSNTPVNTYRRIMAINKKLVEYIAFNRWRKRG